MSILVIGAEGNMGRRYSAILKHIGVSFVGVDKGHSEAHINSLAVQSTGIIIATPSERHVKDITRLAHLKVPILCEKPITRDMSELGQLLNYMHTQKTPFRMVYQYSMLADRTIRDRASFYNYYRHGGDGLAWDCIQILGLANGEVELMETSPVWQCRINGKTLDISNMDNAYIEYIKLWLKQPAQSLKEIKEIHQKVHEYIGSQRKAAHA